MREIVLDTETTGLDPGDGHRVVEIACIELLHHIPSGRRFQRYVNPEREMPQEALAIHGLTDEFLSQQPSFSSMADELLAFLGDDVVVSHNAEFDIGFLNAELARLRRAPLGCVQVDTLALARQRFPGAPASLDALCRRFAIDLSLREKHGAEIDCELLASVYLGLLGGRQPGLEFARRDGAAAVVTRIARAARPHAPSVEELAAHRAMLRILVSPLWLSEG